MSNFQKEVQEIADELVTTLAKKNHDYGNSFAKSYNEYGNVVVSIRLEDKLNRFKNLLSKEQKVDDESIDDTLLDIAGYALLALHIRSK